MSYLEVWLEVTPPDGADSPVWLLQERVNARDLIFESLCSSVKEHLLGADNLERLGYTSAAAVARNSYPTSKQIRSGDLAEIIATDYIDWDTEFIVPLKRLRFKDDRNMSMRGDDIIALDLAKVPARILKAEVKSRGALGRSTIDEACDALDRNDGRPKPESLAFTARRLLEEQKDELAKVVASFLEEDVASERLSHIVFTMSGNNPTGLLKSAAKDRQSPIDRRYVGLIIADHQAFIESVFAALV